MADLAPIRLIKSKERANGMRYCTFCKPERVRATHRNTGVPINKHVSLACKKHIDLLPRFPKKTPIVQFKTSSCDEYYTEADYQTWMRL